MRKAILPVLLILLSAAGFYYLNTDSNSLGQYAPIPRTFEQQAGTRFQPFKHISRSTLTEIRHPWFHGANSIWGATGSDLRGNIWLGISGSEDSAAHLVEFAPGSGTIIDHGDPVSALKETGIYRKGEEQIKIHSKIIQMDDGWLYFSSMDETGEQADGSQLPKWGSHFWRYQPADDHWEHLFTAPEGLIAVSGVGRWIYALGYWGHVLYQYDTQTGVARSIRVGSEGGHISRNIIADHNGHVYVPKVKYFYLAPQPDGSTTDGDWLLVVSLAEYDQHLKKLKGTPLIHYAENGEPAISHGITSFSYLANGSIVFGTHMGFLYRIVPDEKGAATVTELGWLNPDGEAYNPSLFPLDGKRYLAGITKKPDTNYQLFIYDIELGKSKAVELDIPDYNNLLLYGSNTRDEKGRGYLVGRRDGISPVLFQLNF